MEMFENPGERLIEQGMRLILRHLADPDLSVDFLCEKLEVNPEERTLQSMCTQTLNPYEIYDLLLENADVKIGNDMVYASVYSNLVGDFIFYDKDKQKNE